MLIKGIRLGEVIETLDSLPEDKSPLLRASKQSSYNRRIAAVIIAGETYHGSVPKDTSVGSVVVKFFGSNWSFVLDSWQDGYRLIGGFDMLWSATDAISQEHDFQEHEFKIY